MCLCVLNSHAAQMMCVFSNMAFVLSIFYTLFHPCVCVWFIFFFLFCSLYDIAVSFFGSSIQNKSKLKAEKQKQNARKWPLTWLTHNKRCASFLKHKITADKPAETNKQKKRTFPHIFQWFMWLFVSFVSKDKRHIISFIQH